MSGTQKKFNLLDGINSEGVVTFSANLVVDTDTLYVDSFNDRVGINKVPTTALDVLGSGNISGNLTVEGSITATGGVTNISNATITLDPGDAITINGGTANVEFTLNQLANEGFTIAHADTSTLANINNSGNRFIQDLTFDNYGHVTGGTSADVVIPAVNNGTLSFANNAGMTLLVTGGDFTANKSSSTTVTLGHADTSSVTNTNNSGTTVIQNLTFDTFGHVLSTSSTQIRYGDLPDKPSIPAAAANTLISFAEGGAITIVSDSGTLNDRAFGLNQPTPEIFTISHADTSSQASVNNSGLTFIQDVTLDTYGHVTGLASATVTIPDPNTLVGNGSHIISQGGGIVVSTDATFTANKSTNSTTTISHADTSSQASVNNSGVTYIQDVTLDAYGHVTGLVSATTTLAGLGAASSTHTHGSITNTGTITSDTAVASGDKIVMVDATDSGVKRSNIAFGTATTTYLRNNGTWGTPPDTNTTYTAGNGLQLSGTQFSMSGTYTGTFTATVDVVAQSDRSLKDDIRPLGTKDCLDIITQLQPVSFLWKESHEYDTGLIAQDVQQVLPERVKGDDILAVSYGKLTTQLIGAVQELQKQIEELKAQLQS